MISQIVGLHQKEELDVCDVTPSLVPGLLVDFCIVVKLSFLATYWKNS
jgi:hypothetical protein